MAYFMQGDDAEITYNFDFADWEVGGATVGSFVSEVFPIGATLSDGVIAAGICPVRVANVGHGDIYRVKVNATLSSGDIVSKEIAIRGAQK